MENNSFKADKIIYKTLYGEMRRCGFRPTTVAGMIGVDPHTLLNKMNGKREWKLWECLEIKRVIGSEMPIETLFARYLTNL